MRLPWEFVNAPAPGEKGVPNLPTPEGAELGRHFARFFELEADKTPPSAPRCDECAYRLGTIPNQCAPTLMTALKCIIEREPFYCHTGADDEPKRLCAGHEVLSRNRIANPKRGGADR